MELKSAYIADANCITPLGFGVGANIEAMADGRSGIRLFEDAQLLPVPFHAAMIDDEKLEKAFGAISSDGSYTRLEKMLILALHPIIVRSAIRPNGRTGFILSTTKGNITSLTTKGPLQDNVHLYRLGSTIASFFGFTTRPVVVSNACVSGILAISVAKRLLQAGMYDNIFVVAGDEVSEFVLSGFNAFQAMSAAPCRPYSANRSGVTLGEAAAAVLVASEKGIAEIAGDSSINDANHISGPSRKGEGLVHSISNAMNDAGVTAAGIDYISAHGTATTFNDEMEAIAFNRTDLGAVPLNSFKGYYGHTLGTSGLLEAVMGIECMVQGKLLPSYGYDMPGVSEPLNVITKNTERTINCFLKTASGFGGCNTAVVFKNTGNGKS